MADDPALSRWPGGRSYGRASSEEMEEISQLCRRVFELEQEIRRLDMIAAHVSDTDEFTLTYDQLVGYGFTTAP